MISGMTGMNPAFFRAISASANLVCIGSPRKRMGERAQLLQFFRRDLLNLALEAEAECEELRPKAAFFDRVADSSDSFSLAEAAKMLGTEGYGRNSLIKFLRREGVLMARNVAKQRYIDRGYLHIVQSEYLATDGTPRVKAVTRVYEKGVNFIRHRLDNFLLQYMERQNSGY